MSSSTTISPDNDVEKALLSLSSSLSKKEESSTGISSLETKLEGPSGVIHFLLPRLWLSTADESQNVVQGDNVLSILSYLVESRPTKYMSLIASAVRQYVEHNFTSVSSDDEQSKDREVSDALIMALSKLLIGPNSDNQVGIATNAQAALFALCRWDRDQNNHCSTISKRTIVTIDTLWYHLQQQGKKQQRESSTSQMRIAALMIDICLLGEKEISFALCNNCNDATATHCIMDKLLRIALDHPNEDPLLQVSALDQLERLTVHDDVQYPVTSTRAEFLLGHDILRRGLLCLVGSHGDLSKDADGAEWGEPDPINGGAALRLLTDICRVGVGSSVSISEATRNKFQLLLSSFQKSLHNFHPQGELERLSFIYAVSSLVASCAVVASSTSSATDVASTILNDTALLHEWLSLHSRVSQPKLKATVLCSLSQVMEPPMWTGENLASNSTSDATPRPSDNVVLQLYQTFSRANNERDSTELILTSAKSPFEEERLGAYNVLRALVMRGVGLRLLLLYNDGTDDSGGSSFLEWLLNQKLEYTPEGKKAKYQIVHSMLSCNGDILGGLISARALQQLEEWKRSGPNFMKTVAWEMATE